MDLYLQNITILHLIYIHIAKIFLILQFVKFMKQNKNIILKQRRINNST